jgi:hypothetical protein
MGLGWQQDEIVDLSACAFRSLALTFTKRSNQGVGSELATSG